MSLKALGETWKAAVRIIALLRFKESYENSLTGVNEGSSHAGVPLNE